MRNYFSINIIKALFDNLTELKKIKFEWNDLSDRYLMGSNNPIFVRSELEEIFGIHKNKFKVEISAFDCWFRITREM